MQPGGVDVVVYVWMDRWPYSVNCEENVMYSGGLQYVG